MIKLSLIVCLFFFVGALCGFGNAEELSCFYCGMHQAKFEHSWMVIEYSGGRTVGFCSIHCAALDMALQMDKTIQNITVGDYPTKKQIDADKACWVIGGDIMGVMTANAKWAFETKAGADEFMKNHGGRPANFGEVIKAAFDDMYQDTLMIRKKRKLINMRKNPSQ